MMTDIFVIRLFSHDTARVVIPCYNNYQTIPYYRQYRKYRRLAITEYRYVHLNYHQPYSIPSSLIQKQKKNRSSLTSPILTFKFLPVSLSISCLAMSGDSVTHLGSASGSLTTSASHSHSRCATLAYAPAGVACVTLMLVTTPVLLPARCAHSMLDTA